MRIKCSTLFDITQTGIGKRLYSQNSNSDQIKLRNQQINFETILQIISLRCQPENISDPIKKKEYTQIFGTCYRRNVKLYVWEFTFTVNHADVFNDGNNKLGHLFKDSDEIPMLVGLEESQHIGTRISIVTTTKNIHYEIVNYE